MTGTRNQKIFSRWDDSFRDKCHFVVADQCRRVRLHRLHVAITTNLLSPAASVTNSPAPVIIAGQNTITNPITGPQQFYRLVQ